MIATARVVRHRSRIGKAWRLTHHLLPPRSGSADDTALRPMFPDIPRAGYYRIVARKHINGRYEREWGSIAIVDTTNSERAPFCWLPNSWRGNLTITRITKGQAYGPERVQARQHRRGSRRPVHC